MGIRDWLEVIIPAVRVDNPVESMFNQEWETPKLCSWFVAMFPDMCIPNYD